MNSLYDIVIVGGGMVGTALAAALGSSELKIALIEPQLPIPATPCGNPAMCNDYDFRVSALNRSSQDFLQRIGAWKLMPSGRLSPYDKMRVWDGEGTGHIQFDADELGETRLGHIVENRVTSSALFQVFQQHKNLHLLSPASVTEIEQVNELWHLTLSDGQSVVTKLLVGADGARSNIRQWAAIETREWDYGHHGLVCTVATEKSHQNAAWQRFTATGPLAFLPLPDSHLSSVVWSCPQDEAEHLLGLSDIDFLLALEKAFEGMLGEVTDVGARTAIPLRQRHAKTYHKNAVVLIGDAAHTIHPLAGQGVNLGLMDAAVLSEELLRANERGISCEHSQVLARYERRRMPDNLTMMTTMEFFKRLFDPQPPFIRWARNWGMSKLNKMSLVKQHLIQGAMGLKQVKTKSS